MDQGASNPARHGDGSLADAAMPGVETLLRVSLWSGASSVDASAVPSSALDMIRDRFAVDGGLLLDSSSSALTASFRDAAQAVHAARHLQRLVRGVGRASSAGSLHASFTLMASHEAGAIGLPDPRTYPGQVLCIGSLCRTIQAVPGAQFTSFAAGAAEGARLSGPVLQLLPLMHMESYVNEAVEPRLPVAADNSSAAAEPRRFDASARPSMNAPAIRTISPRLVIGGVAAAVLLATLLVFHSYL